MIQLYGISASRAFRPLWMLEELGIEFEHIPTHFQGDAQKPDFLELNPNGKVPVLVDGDLTLFESMAINLYLAKKYDGGLQPKTAENQARALQWSFWVMTELEKPVVTILLNRVFYPEDQRDPDAVRASQEALPRPLAVLDGVLGQRPYLVGEQFSVADLNVASVMTWADPAGIDLGAHPNIRRWLDGCLARPALKRAQQR